MNTSKSINTDQSEFVHFLTSPDSEGLLLVDKPTGVTSHDVVDWARKISGIRRIGHTGTLDPLATGLLILLLGRQYTRLQAKYLHLDKSYICEARLGVETDSYDVEGQVVRETDWEVVSQLSRSEIEATLQDFQGRSEQTVPAFSAVKQSGKKLYQLARSGGAKNLYLPSRAIEISLIKLLKVEKNETKKIYKITFAVRCSSGTYIRSLASDIGKALGVGASVTALERTSIGSFELSQATICPLYNNL